MLINETQLPHLKVTQENLRHHIAGAKELASCTRDGLWLTITYNEMKGYEGDLFILQNFGLVVLTDVRVYDYSEMVLMANNTYRHEGFETPQDYLSELTRLYKGVPAKFYVHTFLQINRGKDD